MRDSVVLSEKVSPFEGYSAKEWVDSEGHLKIPFDREEILKDADMTRVAYYIPDEVARSAKTDEQKTLLIKKLVTEYPDKKSGKLMSGSTNGEYVKFFTWVEEGNAWYYAINDMSLTAGEWEVIDNMMEWNEKER